MKKISKFVTVIFFTAMCAACQNTQKTHPVPPKIVAKAAKQALTASGFKYIYSWIYFYYPTINNRNALHPPGGIRSRRYIDNQNRLRTPALGKLLQAANLVPLRPKPSESGFLLSIYLRQSSLPGSHLSSNYRLLISTSLPSRHIRSIL